MSEEDIVMSNDTIHRNTDEVRFVDAIADSVRASEQGQRRSIKARRDP